MSLKPLSNTVTLFMSELLYSRSSTRCCSLPPTTPPNTSRGSDRFGCGHDVSTWLRPHTILVLAITIVAYIAVVITVVADSKEFASGLEELLSALVSVCGTELGLSCCVQMLLDVWRGGDGESLSLFVQAVLGSGLCWQTVRLDVSTLQQLARLPPLAHPLLIHMLLTAQQWPAHADATLVQVRHDSLAVN